MQFILVSALLLAQALSALSQHPVQLPYDAHWSCEERAKEAGIPTDGWKVVFDNEQWVCRRESVEEFHGSDRHKACIGYPVCGSGNSLGIKYGHCYILSYGDGVQLSSVRENMLYSKRGYFRDIPFKICKDTDDCTRGKVVERREKFYLEDQQGRYNDSEGRKGWIDNASGNAFIGFTLDAAKAGVFEGIPTCGGGECAIRLLRGPNPPNPQMHNTIRFSEVTCDDYEVPLTSGISPNFQD